MPLPVRRPYRLLSSDSEDDYAGVSSSPIRFQSKKTRPSVANNDSLKSLLTADPVENQPESSQTSLSSASEVSVQFPLSARDQRFLYSHQLQKEQQSKKTTRSCLKTTISIEKFIDLVFDLNYVALSRLNKIPIYYFMPNFEDGETIMHKLVVNNKSVVISIVRLLVKRFQAPLDILSHAGESLINIAIRSASKDDYGNWKNEMIETLIDLHCDVNLESLNAERPLFVAYQMNNYDAVILLITSGANPAYVVAFESRLSNTSTLQKLRELICDKFIELNQLLFQSCFYNVNFLYAHLIPTSITTFKLNPEEAKKTVRFTYGANDVPLSRDFVYVLEVQSISFDCSCDSIHLSTSNDTIVKSAFAYGKQLCLLNPEINNVFDITAVFRRRPPPAGSGKRVFIAELVLSKTLLLNQNFIAVVMRYQTVKN